MLFTEVRYAGDDSGPAADAARYRNPVVAGFYTDPSAIRVGDDFHLVNSTFGYFPCLPVFHSRDLVSWRQIGNAIDRAGQINYGNGELTRGLFCAPPQADVNTSVPGRSFRRIYGVLAAGSKALCRVPLRRRSCRERLREQQKE